MNKIIEMYNNMKQPLISEKMRAKILAEQYYKDFYNYTYPPINEHVALMLQSIEENEANIEAAIAEYHEDVQHCDVRLHEYTDQFSWDKLINNEYNNLIRSRNLLACDGFCICISPKAGTIKYKELISLTMKLAQCELVKSFFFYIEFYTDGSPEGNKPHIHLYGIPHNQNHKVRNSIRSYLVSIFRKHKPNIHMERKMDITYGREYISAPASTPEKQSMKAKDAVQRKYLGLEDYYTYN